jgi:DNA-binding winged helix-turn-helix (wHTH) protein
MRIRFGEHVFDAPARVLTRAGKRVTLSPRAFDLLQILLERRPQVVPQAELRDRLWPRTFVAYTSLARLVSEVRKAVGDSSRQSRLVRTVYGHGYAFSGEAVASLSGCALVWADRVIPLLEGENVIGRGVECQVRIESTRVSRRHARIVVTNDEAVLDDLDSKNGTFLGSTRVTAPRGLRPGDEVLVGPAVLYFRGPAGLGPTETA